MNKFEEVAKDIKDTQALIRSNNKKIEKDLGVKLKPTSPEFVILRKV